MILKWRNGFGNIIFLKIDDETRYVLFLETTSINLCTVNVPWNINLIGWHENLESPNVTKQRHGPDELFLIATYFFYSYSEIKKAEGHYHIK